MSFAVPTYAICLVLCPFSAWRRGAFALPGESQKLWTFVCAGYCIYCVSDALLGLDRFSVEIAEPARTILVMSTYWLGQLLIGLACDFASPELSVVPCLWPQGAEQEEDVSLESGKQSLLQ